MFGLFGKKGSSLPSVPRGFRAYAVGDIHGRLDLLDEMLRTIVRDSAIRGRSKTVIVFLGDLIDRGPASSQVIERLRTWRHDGVSVVILMGNHEEVMLRVLDGDGELLRQWLRFGGAECLASYGLDVEYLRKIDDSAALALIQRAIPQSHVAFLRGFGDTLSLGDYLFVHAGIRPGIPLEHQARSDLRWIREPFLSHDDAHPAVVVHGHTIREEVDERANRIGIDTGAYRTGTLTAVGLQGHSRWFLQATVANHAGRETNAIVSGCDPVRSC